MSNTLRVLFIDNSPEDRILAMRELRCEIPDLQVEQITGAEEFSQALEGGNFDLVLTDYRLQWADGLEVLRAVKARWPECPVIMLADTKAEEIALEAMEAGLDDYVLKSPQHFARLPIVARSALKRAQQCQALRETEARYRGLFDGMPVGIYRTAPEGQALDANPALVQMLGYPDREALLAVNAADVYANTEDRRRWQAMMEHEGVVHEFEAQLRRCDGTTIWVQDSARAVRDSDGRVLYYEGVMEDITQRKQAEEALRRERTLPEHHRNHPGTGRGAGHRWTHHHVQPGVRETHGLRCRRSDRTRDMGVPDPRTVRLRDTGSLRQTAGRRAAQ